MAMASLRQHFPALLANAGERQQTYFDSAATSHKTDAVLAQVEQFYRYGNANVHRASHRAAKAATDSFEQARFKVAKFIHAASEKEIVWTKGATESINLLASGLAQQHWPKGKHILISACEHHANIVPWQQLAASTGLTIQVIPVDKQGVLQLNTALEMINHKTAILAIGHVSNALGNIHPIAPILRKAKQCGAISVVDGTQAVAHLHVDVQQLDCDFYVFSGHKMYGPTGTGVLYGKYASLEALPVYQCGGEMIRKVSFTHSSFQPPPLKFESGTPNIAGILGLSAAVDFIQQQRQQIQQIEHRLYQQLLAGLRSIPGLTLWGDCEQSISIQSFTLAGLDNQDIGMMLDEQGYAVRVGHHCAMPLMDELGINGTVRVSLSCYNSNEEVSAFIDALQKGIDMLSHNKQKIVADKRADVSLTPLADRVREAKGWDSVYRHIMLAGKAVAVLPAESRVAENEIHGCESQVWLDMQIQDQHLAIGFYSPSKVIRGLLALLVEPINHRHIDYIRQFNLHDHFAQLGLDKHLSQSRGNGLKAVMSKIQQAARQAG